MAQSITITIQDDAVATEIENAFDALIAGRTTETKGEWIKKNIIRRMKQVLFEYRRKQAVEQADTSDITIT